MTSMTICCRGITASKNNISSIIVVVDDDVAANHYDISLCVYQV